MSINLIAGRRESFFLVCLLVIVGSSNGGRALNKDMIGQVFQWDKMLRAYDAYIERPSLENAKSLVAALPNDQPAEVKGDADTAFEHIFSSDSYPVLYEEAISGVREAIEVHFRLLNVSDGLFSENVESTLGLILRNHPRLFLELLKGYRDTKHIRRWGYPVEFIGSGHNMHLKAALHILGKRMEALETIKDADLMELAEACLDQLRRAIKRGSPDDSVYWDDVRRVLKEYETRPTHMNAARLLAQFPEKPATCQLGNRESAGLALLESVPLAEAIVAGDERLAETAFRLLGYVGGGALDEELTIILGRFLTKKPVIFLKLLKKYLDLFSSERDYPVTMTEILEIVPDITSDEDSHRRKIEETRLYMERIKALESVQGPELKELKEACIRVIRAIIKSL